MKETYRSLNAELNILGENGEIQFDKDTEAAKAYFLEHVNPNTVFFHSLKEKRDYLIENGYWDAGTFDNYSDDDVKAVFRAAYAHKFRFRTFLGAYKFYNQYALKTFDGERYLERYEDRVAMVALHLAEGDVGFAHRIVEEIITGRFQPATPTFLNLGKAQRGEPVSCFLLRVEDNMESIGRVVNSSLQLSKRGGGVGILLTNIREQGAPIKRIEGQSSGVVPVMKILEDSFSYANQLGARQGAGAVYLHAHHPDIMRFLDTKRENADEKVRIKTLSLGVVVPDITFELARKNEDMYLFSPYDVERVEGKPMADLSVTEHYAKWVEDDRIRKSKVSARKFFQTLAEIQFESGYPYILFEDNANRPEVNPVGDRVNMSNLCVAPETQLLTDTGYHQIKDLAEQWVNAWNGEEFSRSYVAKTGESQKLITVDFDNGARIDATEYHKFYVKTGYGNCKVVEKRTSELQPGDMIEKFDLPIIDNKDAADFPYAYTAGLHTAEGTYSASGSPVLRLYPGKLELGEHIDYKSSSLNQDSEGRVSYILHDDVPTKYTVPTDYSLRSRLQWLAGLIDGDGWGNGKAGIQIASIHPAFLEDVRIMLTTLGVSSHWTKVREAGETKFKEGQKAYPTKPLYRLCISGSEVQKLRKLGLPTKRVIIEDVEGNRAANGYIRVESVSDHGRVDDTYCLTEPKLHKVIFNGVRTGQCSEILQGNEASVLNEDLTYAHVGRDISCNLGSLNIAKAMESGNLAETVGVAIMSLSAVSSGTSIDSVPPVRRGNAETRAIGLGQMNLHGYLGSKGIHYGSPEAIEFVDAYFRTVLYHALLTSCELAALTHSPYEGWEKSGWATGSAFEKYLTPFEFKHEKVRGLFDGIHVPQPADWEALRADVAEYGLYNKYLLAVPPTGSISYINDSTSSIHPVASQIEIRKEGKTGRTYYPSPGLSNENREYFADAYEIGPEKIIDTYAAAQQHTDQGLSLTLFFPDTATTRDLNRAQIYAWRKGIKTLYYIRLRQAALGGTEVEGCVSCQL